MLAVVQKVDAAEAQAHAALRELAARDNERRRAAKKKTAITITRRPPQPPLARS